MSVMVSLERVTRCGIIISNHIYTSSVLVYKRSRHAGVHPLKMKSKKLIEKQNELLMNIDVENQYERLAQNITPYWQLAYEEELVIKQKKCEDSVVKILESVSQKKDLDINTIVQQIIPSPITDGYRNKDELSAWCGVDNVPKTVGLLVGGPAAGRLVCIPVTQIRSIKQSHKEIVQMYQELIRSSPLPASYQLFDGGFWRQVSIRSNNAGDHLLLIVTNPYGLTDAELTDQEEAMRRHFGLCAPSLNLLHQSCPHMTCTREQAPFRCLSGDEHMTQTVCGRPIRVSVDSFFPLNMSATEIMVQEVIRLAKLTHSTTLLDLYCGVGALSVMAHDLVRGCVGIETVVQAVEDAKHNAASNGASNCRFIAGKVQQLLPAVLKQLENSPDIVAVVNPGRSGANESVISALRHSRQVKRLVYVFRCGPDGGNPLTLKNFVQLCERFTTSSRPFRLIQATPIDTCPLTTCCDLILCFDKI